MKKITLFACLILSSFFSIAQAPVGSNRLILPDSISELELVHGLSSLGHVVEYTSPYVIRTSFSVEECHSNYTVDVKIFINRIKNGYSVSARYKVGAGDHEYEAQKEGGLKSWGNCAFIEIERFHRIFNVGYWQ